MDRIIKRNHQLIAARMAPHGFSAQRDRADLYLVRPSHKSSLFERIEMRSVGKRDEAFCLRMSLSILQCVLIGFRGCDVGGSLEELSTDPERADRVIFDTAEDVEAWLGRLVAIAPIKVRDFAEQRGNQLLQESAAARSEALRTFSDVVLPALEAGGLDALIAAPRPDQRELLLRLFDRPLILGAQQLRPQYEAAITALVLERDDDLLRLGAVQFTPSDDPLERVEQLGEVSNATMQRIRLIVDLIVRHQSAN